MDVSVHLLLSCFMIITTYGTTVTPPEISLSDYLWQETNNLHVAAFQSSFIQGLKTVTLDPSDFGGFMVQDSIYCYKVKGILDIASAKTNNPALQAFLRLRSKSYESYYKSLFNVWYIGNPVGIELGSACSGYVNHLNNVATTKDPIYLVVALIPCARLWPWLGGQLLVKSVDFGVYNKWVQENLDPDYHGYDKYEKVINKAFTDGLIDKQTALDVYKLSMQSEVAFFSSV